MFPFFITVLIFAGMLMAIVAVIASLENNKSKTVNSGFMIPITITFSVSEKDKTVTVDIDAQGFNVKGLKGSPQYDSHGNLTGFTVQSKEAAKEMELPLPPAKLSWFSNMPCYSAMLRLNYALAPDSAQMKFDAGCSTDSEGFRKYGSAYLIALGEYYGKSIGEKYTLTFKQKDGSSLVISAVRGDTKRVSECDANKQYHAALDNSVVEFLMDGIGGAEYNATTSQNTLDKKFGELIKIEKGGTDVNLVATITGNMVSIVGTIDGVPVTANGTYSASKGTASGTWGDGETSFSDGGKGTLGWPVRGKITSYFGPRNTGIPGASTDHGALDIAALTGTPIRAAEGGIVSIASEDYFGYGKFVEINHTGYTGGSLKTRYGHNSMLKVKAGDTVKRGDIIALCGSTGISSGPHCHFEVVLNGTKVDPLGWLE